MRSLRLVTSFIAISTALAGTPFIHSSAQAQDDQTDNRPANSADKNNGASKGRHKGTKPDQEPALITADQITHDRDLNTVTATGHVEIDQAGRTLLADHLSYNLKQDVIVATGNVSISEPTGEVNFADYIELTGDMKETASRGIHTLMVDDSRMAANTGRRIAGDRTVLNKAVYTACKPCADDPKKPPLWDLKAIRVTHDEVEHVIEYEDAWMELGGIPVAYTPYISHADPSVKRRSGIMPVSVINNNIIGTGVRTPYFQVLSSEQDILVAPLFTSKEGDQLAITHRWRGYDGESKTTASVVQEPAKSFYATDTTSWHVDSTARFAVDESWRAGWNIQRASDKYYLPNFGYHPNKPYLTTNPYVEGFDYRSYTKLEAYAFQNLSEAPSRVSDPTNPNNKRPNVLPLLTYSYIGEPSDHGGYFTFDTHTASINREVGPSSRRVNTLTSWHLPYIAPDGEVYNLTTSLRADTYNSDHLSPLSSKMVNAYRAQPQVTLDWRYPFSKSGEHSSQVLTPILVATLAPYGGNSHKIPNEDALDFELDDINVFSPTPYTGYDHIMSGPRVIYGLEYTAVNRGSPGLDVVLGQSFQPHPDRNFNPGAGLDHNLSDVVGRAEVMPSANFSIGYRFRANETDGTLRRSEITSTIGPLPFSISNSFVFFDKLSPTSPYNAREQLVSTISSQLSHYWSTQIYSVENLGVKAGPLQSGIRLTYDDECFQLSADAGSNHTTIKTFTAGHYLMFRFVFKTLTQFPVSAW